MGITSRTRGKSVHGGVTVLDDVTINDTLTVTGAATLSSTLSVTGAATLSSTLGVTGNATFSGKAFIADELYFDGADACAIKFKSASDYTDGLKAWDTYFGQEGVESYADGLISVQAPIGTDYYIPIYAYANVTEK